MEEGTEDFWEKSAGAFFSPPHSSEDTGTYGDLAWIVTPWPPSTNPFSSDARALERLSMRLSRVKTGIYAKFFA